MISEHAYYPLSQSDATSEWKGSGLVSRFQYLTDWSTCLILLIFTLLALICRYDFLGWVLRPSVEILLTSIPFAIATSPRARSCFMEEDRDVRFLWAEHSVFTPLAILSFLVARTSTLEVPNCLANTRACTYTRRKWFEAQAVTTARREGPWQGVNATPFTFARPLVYLAKRCCPSSHVNIAWNYVVVRACAS